MMQIPAGFTDRMRRMLGDEFDAFVASYDRPRRRGLRVNTMKISPECFLETAPFPVSRIPWVDNGFFCEGEASPASHPWYAAGVYYLQEASAMTPASRLPVSPGDRVLDLCAAPGGKATELAAKLNGTGLLVANDISSSRARALLRNLELFGATNILVTNEAPVDLARSFPAYFDKILVDAPCSGEGMFRKSEEAGELWSQERVESLAKQQRTILSAAAAMLRPGGMLLYSTCTFAPEEDEGSVSYLLRQEQDLELIPIDGYEGFDSGRPAWGDGNPDLARCVRIWPHRMEGEGHFLALFRKAGDDGVTEKADESEKYNLKRDKKMTRGKKREEGRGRGQMTREQREEIAEFLPEGRFDRSRIECRADHAYYVPPLPDSARGLHFLRCGLYIGDWKKNRFEPSQPYALALRAGDFPNVFSLSSEDQRTAAYLKGESIGLSQDEQNAVSRGWVLVCADGFPIGFGKAVQGVIKNKIPAAWRKSGA